MNEKSRTMYIAAVALGGVMSVLVLAYGLKRHYSTATPLELRWVLAPTTTLVECITREPFSLEPGAGYVSTKLHTTIAPACAGVNHLIIAFVTLALGFLRDLQAPTRKCAWIATSGAAAYLATLVVNATRIAAGIGLHESGIGAAWVSPAALHRAEGVVVYLGSLWLLALAAEAGLARTEGTRPSTRSAP